MGLDPDMEELMRVCDALMPYLNDEEGEELVCFVNFIRQKTTRLYDDSIASPLLLRSPNFS